MKQNLQQFDYQNFLDAWSKEKLRDIKKNIRYLSLKSRKLKRKLNQEVIKTNLNAVQDTYYANKALYHKADSDLPFTTLTQIGKILSNTNYHHEMIQIIQKNVIKYNGVFYKLNDIENQNLIRKVLRTYQFEKLEELKAA